MTDNIKFYIAVFEICTLSILMMLLNIILVKSDPLGIPYLPYVCTIMYNALILYVIKWLFLIFYNCIKIHNIVNKYKCLNVVSILKNNECVDKDEDNVTEEELFKKYLLYYRWVTNKKCQMALNVFTICAILIFARYLWNAPDIFIPFACVFFAVGLVRLFQGTDEVV